MRSETSGVLPSWRHDLATWPHTSHHHQSSRPNFWSKSMSSFPGCRCSALLGAVAPLNTAARYRLRQQLVCSEYFRAPPAGPWFVRPAQQPLRGSALSSADAVGGALGRRCVRGDGVAEGQPVRHGLGPAGGGAGHRGGPMGALGGRALASTALCEPMYFCVNVGSALQPCFGHLRSPG